MGDGRGKLRHHARHNSSRGSIEPKCIAASSIGCGVAANTPLQRITLAWLCRLTCGGCEADGGFDRHPPSSVEAPHTPPSVPSPCQGKRQIDWTKDMQCVYEGLGERLSGGWEGRASVPSAVTTGSCMGVSVMGHRKSLKSGAAIVAEDTSTRVRGRARNTMQIQTFGYIIRMYPNDRNFPRASARANAFPSANKQRAP
jgi:hypothetical protein